MTMVRMNMSQMATSKYYLNDYEHLPTRGARAHDDRQSKEIPLRALICSPCIHVQIIFRDPYSYIQIVGQRPERLIL